MLSSATKTQIAYGVVAPRRKSAPNNAFWEDEMQESQSDAMPADSSCSHRFDQGFRQGDIEPLTN